MNDRKEILEILNEYGIKNRSDLEKAISKTEKIDLTPFCGQTSKSVRTKKKVRKTDVA